jgi:hypothetical protein
MGRVALPRLAPFLLLALSSLACGNGGATALGPGPATGDAAAGPDGGKPAGDAATDTTAPPIDAGPIVAPQPVSPYIVVDQFGYRTGAEKIAVVRSPRTGFDAMMSFAPGPMYAVVDAHASQKVLEAAPATWNGGATDKSSGDVAWWLDLSSVTTPGDYFVLDEMNAVRSDVFHVSDDVYRGVLRAAVRMLYYQRDGIAKDAAYAGAEWADGVAHPQDSACGLYSDGSGPKDLHGGWFDAGDQNRYTNWGASDVIELLRGYLEAPGAFTDDYGIPESGNAVPDLLDEVKWELDWMVRMQNADGSVLSVAGHKGASPPSTDTSPCRYGPANTSATLTSAAAFAFGSIVFASLPAAQTAYPGFASDLAMRAQNAWTWAIANPSVTFYNAKNNLASGEQEVDDATRLQKKVQAAVFLYELTKTATYQSVVDANYAPLQASFDPFHDEPLETLLEYTTLPGATASVVTSILSTYKSGIHGPAYLGAHQPSVDPYLAAMQTYTWGSNQVKAWQGTMFTDVATFKVDATANADAMRDAERYVHYVHGVNPLGLVYLSNMSGEGATSSVTRFFHTWFAHGSKWDAAGVSMYGPPPGYLVGGPNPGYTWDSCCPSGCSGTSCGAAPPSPPTGQPDQKSYKDFNDSWPLDSWQITEPDDGYQSKYIRLLAKFVH